jgi:hypothetical protein
VSDCGVRGCGAGGLALDAVSQNGADVTDAGIEFKSATVTDNIVVKLTTHPSRLSGVVSDAKGEAVVATRSRDRTSIATQSRIRNSCRPSRRMRSMFPRIAAKRSHFI